MKQKLLPSILLFVVVTVAVIIFNQKIAAAGANAWLIAGGNTVLFIATLLSVYMNAKAMLHSNTYGFMRNMYGGFLLKFFILIAAVVAYIVLVKTPNKPGLLVCGCLYLFYTFFGTRNVLNLKKPVSDGNGKSTV